MQCSEFYRPSSNKTNITLPPFSETVVACQWVSQYNLDRKVLSSQNEVGGGLLASSRWQRGLELRIIPVSIKFYEPVIISL